MAPDDRLHDELAELAELAPLGGLAPDEHRRLADHLDAGCAECAARYAEGVAALDVLARAVPPVAPTPGRRDALLDAAVRDRGGMPDLALRRARRLGRFAALAAALAVLLSAGALLTALRGERDALRAVQQARAEVDARLVSGKGRLEALAAQLAHFERVLETSGGRGIRELPLDATTRSVQASARVMVDRGGNQVLLLASRLPPAPPGHTYQLWVIEDGAPRSVGVFDPDEGGRVLHMESAPGDLTREFSVAVSVEPAGGVPQPSGPIVLASH